MVAVLHDLIVVYRHSTPSSNGSPLAHPFGLGFVGYVHISGGCLGCLLQLVH